MKLRALRVPAEPAATLAALRIAVPALVLMAPGLREGVRVAALDPHLRVAPEGLGWFLAIAPVSADLALVVELVTAFAALLAIAGVRARPALVVMTLGAFYLNALAQTTGQVWHDMHLLWLAALLAASPCDHALAYDARAPARDSAAYGLPLGFARLLLGAVYFFPGFHKLHSSGLAWALSDNLRNQIYWTWAEHGALPAFRIDEHPWLLHTGGLFVLAFELGAPILFLVPRTRVLGALCGIAFHLLAQAIFLIPFISLWGCYVVLFDMRPLDARVRRWRGGADGVALVPERHTLRAPFVVGALLLAGVAIQGVRGQMQSYPFACYPTFQWIVGTEMPDLRIFAVSADGAAHELPFARYARGYRTQRQWGTIWSLALGGSEERLRAYYMYVTRFEPARSLARGAVRARFVRAYVSVLPVERGAAPVREETIVEIALAPIVTP